MNEFALNFNLWVNAQLAAPGAGCGCFLLEVGQQYHGAFFCRNYFEDQPQKFLLE